MTADELFGPETDEEVEEHPIDKLFGAPPLLDLNAMLDKLFKRAPDG